MDRDVHAAVGAYYAAKLRTHGPTARGVDWNGEASQRLRFAQLTRIIADDPARPAEPVVADMGCGYGAYCDYLREQGMPFAYLGLDIAPEMIEAARARHVGLSGCAFAVGELPEDPVHYVVASGIFNVRLGFGNDAWQDYMLRTLTAMDRACTRGFAFNCLTSYSDPERMRPDLHYADPVRLFDHCKRAFSRNVALLHDYGLYEFTILVRKEAS